MNAIPIPASILLILRLLTHLVPDGIEAFAGSRPRRTGQTIRHGHGAPRQFRMCFPDDAEKETPSRGLRFDLMKLMRTEADAAKQAQKVGAIASVARAYRKSIADDRQRGHQPVAAPGAKFELPERLASLRPFLRASPRDEDHRGSFQVFSCGDVQSGESPLVSLPRNVLLSTGEPLALLRDDLSHRPNSKGNKRGGMMYDRSEAVVWCGGGYDDRDLEYISKVMDDMPISKLFLGACRAMQGEDDSVPIQLEWDALNMLESMGLLLPDGGAACSPDEGRSGRLACRLRREDLDIIQVALCCYDYQDDEILSDEQETIIRIVDEAVESVRRDPLNEGDCPHLVLMAGSATASRVTVAVETWKQRQIRRGRSARRMEDLLHQALTVLTFGNVCGSFCRGPAYVHVSMLDDPWTAALGTTSASPVRNDGQRDAGRVRDAVHLRALSPYSYDRGEWSERRESSVRSMRTHNAHNICACAIQFLSLVMRINGVRSFRELYDAARYVDPLPVDIDPKHFAVNYGEYGDLVIPPRIDNELLPAMILATGGDRWLWDDEIIFESLLPDEIEAEMNLEESFGYSAYDEIRDSCSSPR